MPPTTDYTDRLAPAMTTYRLELAGPISGLMLPLRATLPAAPTCHPISHLPTCHWRFARRGSRGSFAERTTTRALSNSIRSTTWPSSWRMARPRPSSSFGGRAALPGISPSRSQWSRCGRRAPFTRLRAALTQTEKGHNPQGRNRRSLAKNYTPPEARWRCR